MIRRKFFAWLFGFPVMTKLATPILGAEERETCLTTAGLHTKGEWNPSPGDEPVTRAELATLLKEAGFSCLAFTGDPADAWQAVFNEKSPAYRKLLEQVNKGNLSMSITSVSRIDSPGILECEPVGTAKPGVLCNDCGRNEPIGVTVEYKAEDGKRFTERYCRECWNKRRVKV